MLYSRDIWSWQALIGELLFHLQSWFGSAACVQNNQKCEVTSGLKAYKNFTVDGKEATEATVAQVVDVLKTFAEPLQSQWVWLLCSCSQSPQASSYVTQVNDEDVCRYCVVPWCHRLYVFSCVHRPKNISVSVEDRAVKQKEESWILCRAVWQRYAHDLSPNVWNAIIYV